MKPTINIRPATLEDAPFLAITIMEALDHPVYDESQRTDESNEILPKALKVCQSEDTMYTWKHGWIAEIDGKTVGALVAYDGTDYAERRQVTFPMFGDASEDFLEMDLETGPGEFYLDSMFVIPEYRRQGIGTALLKKGIEHATRLGIPKVTLAVDPHKPDNERLYRSVGLRTTGTFFIFGEDYHRMELATTQPMRIDILTVLPEMVEPFIHTSILARAQKRNLVEIHVHNLRDYTTDKHKRVDDYPYGGCAGMVMQCQPIDACISALMAEREYDEIIFTSPDGEQFNQPMANELSMKKNLIILCGHFKGIDWRIREHLITKEVSIGDYVLTGGELAAAVMTDAIVRIIPGSIGDEQSALSDSFQDNLLAPPVYTRPADYKGWKVPEVLLSGNEKLIRNWEMEQAVKRTKELRPDLLK